VTLEDDQKEEEGGPEAGEGNHDPDGEAEFGNVENSFVEEEEGHFGES